MQVEIEAKFLGVSHTELRNALQLAGAKLLKSMRLMKRLNIDHPNRQLEKRRSWLRLRDEGDRITLTFKQLADNTITGVSEAETIVQDFENTKQILVAIGLKPKSYQESRRETWDLDSVEIVLDEWPWVRPFCEVEGPSEAAVKAAAEAIGLDWDNAVFGAVEPVYQAEYDITNAQFYTVDRIVFDEPLPDILAAKRRLEPLRLGHNYPKVTVAA